MRKAGRAQREGSRRGGHSWKAVVPMQRSPADTPSLGALDPPCDPRSEFRGRIARIRGRDQHRPRSAPARPTSQARFRLGCSPRLTRAQALRTRCTRGAESSHVETQGSTEPSYSVSQPEPFRCAIPPGRPPPGLGAVKGTIAGAGRWPCRHRRPRGSQTVGRSSSSPTGRCWIELRPRPSCAPRKPRYLTWAVRGTSSRNASGSIRREGPAAT